MRPIAPSPPGSPRPPWTTDLRPVERRVLLALAALLIAARFGAAWVEPRFWAEEASLYFSYARTHGWLRSLLLVPTAASPAGYLNLAANLPATLAAKLLPLELAPRLTTLSAFFVQLVPIALALGGRSRLWRHRGQRVAAAALLVLAPCLTGDVWLNSINSQVFLGLAALLLLLEDFEASDARASRRRGVAFGLVGLGAFSGPYTAFLAPLFLARGVLERSTTHLRLGWVALAGALFQATVFAWTHGAVDIAGDRLVERPLAWRLANLVHFQLLRPVFGYDVAEAISRTVGLDAAVWSGSGLDLPPHYLALVGWSSALVLVLVGIWLLRGARRSTRGPLLWLAAAWMTTAPPIAFLIGPSRPSSRYMAVPGVILLLIVLARAAERRRARSTIAALLVAVSLIAGVGDFFREEPPGSLGLAPDPPRWTDEVAAWRDDPEQVLEIWPYVAPYRWRVFLPHAATPPVEPFVLERPLRLVSRGEVERATLPVASLESDFRLDMRLVPSCPPDSCLFRLRLEGADGALLSRLEPPPRWSPGRPFRWAFSRSDPMLDRADLPRVRSLVFVVRSLDGAPVRWIVQDLRIDRRVRGVLEPLLPPGRPTIAASAAARSIPVQTGDGARRIALVTWSLWALFVVVALGAALTVVARSQLPDRLRRRADRFGLAASAVLVGVAPVLAFVPRVLDDRITAVLYREPKLVAGGLAAWLLIAALWSRLRPGDLRATLERTPVLLLGLWLGWSASTRWWGWTPEHWLYEMAQHLTFGALAVTLLAAARRRPGLLRLPLAGLAAATGVATVVGLLQLAVGSVSTGAGWTWLAPIDAWVGVAHPSTMGYKNPMALVLVAQLGVLVGFAATTRSRRLRAALGVLLTVELVYLASLQSRTSLLALAVGALVALLAGALRGLAASSAGRSTDGASRSSPGDLARRRLPAVLVALSIALAVAGALAVGLGWSERARERAAGAVDLATSPADYLETDRGVYLRNTLHMVRDRPLGVGLGDWQTAYPLYRRVEPTLAYDDVYRVRRAHSDHVQALGETGWPGLALWLAMLGAALVVPLRRWWRGSQTGGRDAWHLALGAQMAAVLAAMTTDYVTEMPALELIVACLWAAAVGADPLRGDPDTPTAASTRAGLLGRSLSALAVVLAVVVGLGHLTLLGPRLLAADARAILDAGSLEIDGRRAIETDAARRVVAIGHRLERWPGLSKTLHRDARVLAVAADAAGDEATALRWARWSLRLHRHDPDTLLLLSTLTGDPGGRYRRAAEEILRGANPPDDSD